MIRKNISDYLMGALSLMMGVATVTIPWTAGHAASGEVMKVRVAMSDLDLTTKDGVRKLDGRINRAARKLCGTTFSTPDLRWNACMHAARQRARLQRDAFLIRLEESRLNTRPDNRAF